MKRATKRTRALLWAVPSVHPATLAMSTAAELFASTATPETLLVRAAQTLAADPGDMCLISVVSSPGDVLQPVAIAHARKPAARHLADQTRWGIPFEPDAFSREVQRTGRSLRMGISNPSQLHLWLGDEYATFAERTDVGGVLAAALTRHSRVVGTVLLWREQGQEFTDADEAYVAALAGRLGLGI